LQTVGWFGTFRFPFNINLPAIILFLRLITLQQGNPVLQEVKHECHYEFDWATNIICPSFRSKVNNQDCVIHNEEINRSLNLKDIFAGEKISVKDDVGSFSCLRFWLKIIIFICRKKD
jgi:hypothetical protein